MKDFERCSFIKQNAEKHREKKNKELGKLLILTFINPFSETIKFSNGSLLQKKETVLIFYDLPFLPDCSAH